MGSLENALSVVDLNHKIEELLSDIQANFRCPLCQSTVKNPILTACNHGFCKECFNACFKHLRKIDCPLCRTSLNRRACTDSPQYEAIGECYRQLARNFYRDVQQMGIVAPKGREFLESQADISNAVTDSPMRQFREEPVFAIPKVRVPTKRRRPLKMELMSTAKMSRVDEESGDLSIDNCDLAIEMNPKLETKSEVSSRSSSLEQKPIIQYAPPEPAHVRILKDAEAQASCEMVDAEVQCYSTTQETLLAAIADIRNIITTDFNGSLTNACSSSKELSEFFTYFRCEMDDISFKEISHRKEQVPEPSFRALKEEKTPNKESSLISRSAKIIVPGSPTIVLDSNGDVVANDAGLSSTPVLRRSPRKNLSNFKALCEEQRSPRKSQSNAVIHCDEEVVPASRSGSLRGVDDKENEVVQDTDMDITIGYYESVEEVKETLPQGDDCDPSQVVLALSRYTSRDDDILAHEFRMSFPEVRVTEEVTPETTHLVMLNCPTRRLETRSLRMVFGMVYGSELLSRSWLVDCIQQKRLLDTVKYRMEINRTTPTFCASQRSQSSQITKTHGELFAGRKFLLIPRFCQSDVVPREKLVQLIEACGGKIVTKIWEVQPPHAYMIFAPQSLEADAARRFEQDTKVPVLSGDWILDSIFEMRLVRPIETYRIALAMKKLRGATK